jgi:YegS/Rv2252/BmrU family lipid kinase
VDAVILINRGGGSAGDDAGDKVRAALAKAGIAGEVALLDGAGLARRAKQAVADGAGLIVAGGGDGTISAAASAVADTNTRLGILPLGTLNHLARDLGIPADLDQAAALIATGTERRVDLAEMNGRIFINNSAIGLYPLMVLDRASQQRRLGRSKRLAMLVASARTLARFNHQRLTLTLGDRKALIDTPLLFVGNNEYRTELPAAGTRDRLDDGRLSVLVLRSKTRLGFIAATLRALVGRTRSDDMIRLDSVERLRVDSRKRRLSLSLDGEVLRAEPPLEYRIRKGALRVIAPPQSEPAS